MSGSLSTFLLDTLLWTGVLIAAVLLLRRPVARHFGPQAAYALWALPLLRLAFPPVTLPAWLRPDEEAAVSAVSVVEPTVHTVPAAMTPTTPEVAGLSFDWVTLLLALWLAGAGLFLLRRFALYHRMRRELLDGSRPVGEAGKVRLVETPALSGPVAFGLRDKVVALPMGFMARMDRRARDLALAHELAHHRGHDLLVNILAQPLFALHWFNPLGWTGWRALRRDQEAACDARVVERCNADERAAYAGVIAEFARRSRAAPRAALAAPMACPVLGDKSIVQRLRNLTMTEISLPRRRVGRLVTGIAILALPLTASITYAESSQDAADAGLDAAVAQQNAEDAARAATDAQRDVDNAERDATEAQGEAAQALHDADRAASEARSEARTAVESQQQDIVHRTEEPGKPVHVERHVIHRGDGVMTEAERVKMQAEIDRGMAAMNAHMGRSFAENGRMQREIRFAMAEARRAAPQVVMSCKDENEPVTSVEKDGRTTLFVCQTAGNRMALEAIRSARASMAADEGLSADIRAEVLRSLDVEIARLDK